NVDNTGTVSVNGVISGAGGLTKTGSGLLSINSVQAYRGGTSVNGGTLIYGVDNALYSDDGIYVGAAGTVDLNGHNASAAYIDGSGNMMIGNKTLTIGDGRGRSFGGDIAGAGGHLVKNGTGTMFLLGNNSYTGGTTVTGGTLVGTAASLPGDIVNDAFVV
ncbi:MAG TPA: autotransporter-associated beta strand repeat-containing protein, partial [bacterium]|nr:autotransporter-associated beta strand repeat-containing protein [bacterium]